MAVILSASVFIPLSLPALLQQAEKPREQAEESHLWFRSAPWHWGIDHSSPSPCPCVPINWPIPIPIPILIPVLIPVTISVPISIPGTPMGTPLPWEQDRAAWGHRHRQGMCRTQQVPGSWQGTLGYLSAPAGTRMQVGSGDNSSQHLSGAQEWSIWVQLLRERGRGGLTRCANS